jgi:hypothetical protein
MPKQILPSLVVALILLVGGAFFIFSNPRKDQNSVSSVPQEKWNPQTIEEVQGFTTQAVDKKDETLCFQFTQCFYQSTCLTQVAAAKKDSGICNIQVKDCEGNELLEMTGDFPLLECIQGVELLKIGDVSSKGDPARCAELQGEISWFSNRIPQRDLCITQVAISQSNADLCDLIEKKEVKDSLGLTLEDNCLIFTSLEPEEQIPQTTGNPFRELFDLFPANGELQTCLKNTLEESFVPAYRGEYKGESLVESFEICMEPRDEEGQDRAAARLLPESLPCIEQVLGSEEFNAFMEDPFYVISLEANEEIKKCPFINQLNTVGEKFLEYVK